MTDKKRTELDWQDMRMFLALGRYRSLSSAARALQVNHATVARRGLAPSRMTPYAGLCA